MSSAPGAPATPAAAALWYQGKKFPLEKRISKQPKTLQGECLPGAGGRGGTVPPIPHSWEGVSGGGATGLFFFPPFLFTFYFSPFV